MSGMPATEWGTDYWGEVMSEPSEERARSVAKAGCANVYSRAPMGAWLKEVDANMRGVNVKSTVSNKEES